MEPRVWNRGWKQPKTARCADDSQESYDEPVSKQNPPSNFRAQQISRQPSNLLEDQHRANTANLLNSSWRFTGRSSNESRQSIEMFKVERIESELGSIIDKVNSVLLNTKRTGPVSQTTGTESSGNRSPTSNLAYSGSDRESNHRYQLETKQLEPYLDEQGTEQQNPALASFMSFSDLPYSGGEKFTEATPGTPRRSRYLSPSNDSEFKASDPVVHLVNRSQQMPNALKEAPSNQATARTAVLGPNQFTSQVVTEKPKQLNCDDLNSELAPAKSSARTQYLNSRRMEMQQSASDKENLPSNTSLRLSSGRNGSKVLVYPPNMQYRRDLKLENNSSIQGVDPQTSDHPVGCTQPESQKTVPTLAVATSKPQLPVLLLPCDPPVQSQQLRQPNIQTYLLQPSTARTLSPSALSTSRDMGDHEDTRKLLKAREQTVKSRSSTSECENFNNFYADSPPRDQPALDPILLDLRQEEQLLRLRFLCNRQFNSLNALLQLVEESVLVGSSLWAQGTPNLSKPLESVARAIQMVKRTLSTESVDESTSESIDTEIQKALTKVVQNSVKEVYRQLKIILEAKRGENNGSLIGPTPSNITQRSHSVWDPSKISIPQTSNTSYLQENHAEECNFQEGFRDMRPSLLPEEQYHYTQQPDVLIEDVKVRDFQKTRSNETISTVLFKKHQKEVFRPQEFECNESLGGEVRFDRQQHTNQTLEQTADLPLRSDIAHLRQPVRQTSRSHSTKSSTQSRSDKFSIISSARLECSRTMSFRICSMTKYRKQPILGFEDGAIVMLSTESKTGERIEMEKCFRHSTEPTTSLLSIEMAEANNASSKSDLLIVACGIQDPTIALIGLNSFKVVKEFKGGHSQVVTGIQQVEENYFATSSLDKTLKLWDIHSQSTAGCLSTLYTHESPIICSVYSPDLQLLASGDLNGTIALSAVHLEHGRFKSWSNYATIKGTGPILELLFDNYRRVVAFENSRMRVYDCRGTLFKEIQIRLFVASARFLSDGKLLIVDISGKPWFVDYDKLLRASEFPGSQLELGVQTSNKFDEVEMATQLISQRLTGCRPRAQLFPKRDGYCVYSTDGRARNLLVHTT